MELLLKNKFWHKAKKYGYFNLEIKDKDHVLTILNLKIEYRENYKGAFISTPKIKSSEIVENEIINSYSAVVSLNESLLIAIEKEFHNWENGIVPTTNTTNKKKKSTPTNNDEFWKNAKEIKDKPTF